MLVTKIRGRLYHRTRDHIHPDELATCRQERRDAQRIMALRRVPVNCTCEHFLPPCPRLVEWMGHAQQKAQDSRTGARLLGSRRGVLPWSGGGPAARSEPGHGPMDRRRCHSCAERAVGLPVPGQGRSVGLRPEAPVRPIDATVRYPAAALPGESAGTFPGQHPTGHMPYHLLKITGALCRPARPKGGRLI